MKKGIIGLLAAVMLLTAGTGVLAAGRGTCRGDGFCRYPDCDGDGVCDICGNIPGSGCTYCRNDLDGDGICDNAGVCMGPIAAGHHGGGRHH